MNRLVLEAADGMVLAQEPRNKTLVLYTVCSDDGRPDSRNMSFTCKRKAYRYFAHVTAPYDGLSPVLHTADVSISMIVERK